MTTGILRQRKHWALLAAALAWAVPAKTIAQSTWNGSVNNPWSVPGNWLNGNVPGDAIDEDAVLGAGSPIVDSHFTLRDFDFNGGTLEGLLGNVLDVHGAFAWTGGSIAADALMNVTGSLDLSGTLNNSGLLTATIGAGTILVDTATILNNSGTLSVAGTTLNLRRGMNSGRIEAGIGGTILFQGVGSYILAAGSSLAGDGMFSIVSAIDLQESVSLKNLSLSGSVLGGTLSSSGEFVWSSGEMKGGGRTTVLPTGTLHVTTSAIKSLESRELVNNGTIDWSGGGNWLVHSGATVLNNSRFIISGDATMSLAPLTTHGTVINSGTLVKSGGSGTTSILIPLNNTGTVGVTSGTLKVVGGSGGGTWGIGSGATLIFAAGSANPEVLQSGVSLANLGTMVNSGFLSAPAAALTGNNLIMDPLAAAELNIIGDLPVEAFRWNRGVISGPGTSTTTGITFTDRWGVAGGRTLQNAGTLSWATGAAWGLGLVDVISAFDNVNPGTIQNNTGGKLNFESDGVMGLPLLPGSLQIKNAGEIRVFNGKSVSIHGSMNNDGTILLGTGATLNLAAGGASTGTFLVGDGATLIASGNSTHSFSTSVRFNGMGSESASHTIIFDAATSNLSGQVNGSIALQAGANQNSGAALNLLSGSVIEPKAMTIAGGSVNVYSGATIDVPNLYLNSGRMTVAGGASVSVGSTTVGTNGGPAAILKLDSGATFNGDTIELKAPGVLWLDGGTLSSSSAVQIGGSVQGSGTIDASVNSSSAILTPGDVGVVGDFDIAGGLTLDAGTIVGIDVNAETLTSDQIDIGAGLALGGAMLLVTVVGDPSSLSSGNNFVILSSASRSGTFNLVTPGRILAVNLGGEMVGEFHVDYTPDGVTLSNWVPEPPMQSVAVAFAFLLRRRRVSSGTTLARTADGCA